MDGGRLLHAILWKAWKNEDVATRQSAVVATIAASLLIAWVVANYLVWHSLRGLCFQGAMTWESLGTREPTESPNVAVRLLIV